MRTYTVHKVLQETLHVKEILNITKRTLIAQDMPRMLVKGLKMSLNVLEISLEELEINNSMPRAKHTLSPIRRHQKTSLIKYRAKRVFTHILKLIFQPNLVAIFRPKFLI